MTSQTANKQSERQLFAQSGFVIRVLLIIGALSLALLSSACEPEDIPGLAQAPKATLPPPPAAPQDAGPQAWLEYPLEGQTMLLEEAVPFVVYASDAKGVAQLELRVNGEPLPAVQAEALSSDGSSRLVRLDQDWQPAAEGEYIVEARGRNAAGGYGEPTYVKFCVGSCQPVTVTPSPAPQPITITPAPAAQYDLYVRRMDFMQTNPMVGETIQLYIMIATDTYPSQGSFFSASYFRWRQGPNFPWQEESCPADTQYASCAKTVEFAYDQVGSYYVEVEADSRGGIAESDETNNVSGWTITVGSADTPTPTPTGTQPPTPTPTATPTPLPTATPTATSLPPTPTPTDTPLPPPEAVINFWSDVPYVNAGQCTTLHWAVEGVREVYLNGGPVAGQGSQQVCLCEAATYTLRVVKLDGSTEDRQVFIDVYGSCETPEPPPSQDTTGPDISSVWLVEEGTCQFYGQATIGDPSGVSWAQFHFSANEGGWGSLWMQDIGGGIWQTEYPITSAEPSVDIQFYVVASDSLGNENESSPGSDGTFICGGYEM